MEKSLSAAKVLITGGHGFIGRNIAKHLSEKGCKIYGVGRGNWVGCYGAKDFGYSGWVSANVSIDAMDNLISNPDVIINCAGSGSVKASIEGPHSDFKSNVGVAAEVLEYARLHAPLAKIIMLSSAAVYGSIEKMPIKEGEDIKPISPYGYNKKIVEILSESYKENYNLDILVLRLFSVYGAGLRKQLLWDACNKIIDRNYFFHGSGNELRDWIHVLDVAELISLLLLNFDSCKKILNGATGEGVSTNEVLKIICDEFECTTPIKFSGKIRSGDPINYVADVSQIEELGWRPSVNLIQGVIDYVKWFKSLK